MKRLPGILAIVAIVALACRDSASACNVPVFRYALERWRQDSYRVVVVHRGELGEAERKLVRLLEDGENNGAVNFALAVVDLDKLPDPAPEKLLADLGGAPLPRLVVQYPSKQGSDAPLWSAPFTAESVARLTDSPIRQELVRRLAAGQTAVWLFLECGDEEKDKAAAALVEQELRKLEKELKLPELSADPADKLMTSAPLAVGFSLLNISRSAAEEPLVEMLLRSEPDLAERAAPLVFPVFGRGRALFALVGLGITPANIHQSAAFLVGACSCEVKEQNPGFDLLVTAQWEKLLEQAGGAVSSVEPAKSDASAEPELVPIPAGSRSAPPLAAASAKENSSAMSPAADDASLDKRYVVGGVALALMLGITFARLSKRKMSAGRQHPEEIS